jgi:hypothetical protein
MFVENVYQQPYPDIYGFTSCKVSVLKGRSSCDVQTRCVGFLGMAAGSPRHTRYQADNRQLAPRRGLLFDDDAVTCTVRRLVIPVFEIVRVYDIEGGPG